jgi:serine/threonine protein phosphatase PrpC
MATNLAAALEIATATDPGMVRSHNEDSIATDADIGLAVLADGMGGYNAGEVASGIAVAMLSTEMKAVLSQSSGATHVPDEDVAAKLIIENAAKANLAIYQTAKSQPQYAGMGTTLVAALFYDNRMTVGHIGDSRLYRLRSERLEQITRDHSLLQEQLDSGMITKEQARYSQNKNLVTRAVGIDPHVDTECHTYTVETGDTYLLCSDGLSDMVEDEYIRSTLVEQPDLALAAAKLVKLANDCGGRDNISVILVRVRAHFPAAQGWGRKVKSWFKQ